MFLLIHNMYALSGCVLQSSIKERKAFSAPTIQAKMHQKVLQGIRLESLNQFDVLLNIGQASQKFAAVFCISVVELGFS